MSIPFNINDYVYVRLTDKGRALHRADYDALATKVGGTLPFVYTPVAEDKDGWSKWQAWDLMSVFGAHCYNGCVLPFETNIRIETQ